MNLHGLLRTMSVLVIMASAATANSHSHRSTWVYPIEYEVSTPVSTVSLKKRSPPKSLYSWGFAATTNNPQYTFPSYGFKNIQPYRDAIIENEILKQTPSSRMIAIEENRRGKINIDPILAEDRSNTSKRDDHWRNYKDSMYKNIHMRGTYDTKLLMPNNRRFGYDQAGNSIKNDEINNPSNIYDKYPEYQKMLSVQPTEENHKSKNIPSLQNVVSYKENGNYKKTETNLEEVKQFEEQEKLQDLNNTINLKNTIIERFKEINKEDDSINYVSDKSHRKSTNSTDNLENLDKKYYCSDKENKTENANSTSTTETPDENKDSQLQGFEKSDTKLFQEVQNHAGRFTFSLAKTTIAGGLRCFSCDNLTSALCNEITPYTNQTTCSDIEDSCLIIFTKNIFTDKITMRRRCGHRNTCKELDSVATEIKMCSNCKADLCNKSSTGLVNYTVFSVLTLISAYLTIFTYV